MKRKSAQKPWLGFVPLRPEPQRGYIHPPPVNVEQLKREAEAARQLMKDMK